MGAVHLGDPLQSVSASVGVPINVQDDRFTSLTLRPESLRSSQDESCFWAGHVADGTETGGPGKGLDVWTPTSIPGTPFRGNRRRDNGTGGRGHATYNRLWQQVNQVGAHRWSRI